jgi:hypothetical protein
MVDKRFHGMFQSKGLLGVNKGCSAAPHVDFDQGRLFGLTRFVSWSLRYGISADLVLR